MPIRKTSIHSRYAGAQFDNKLRNTTILYKLQELVQAILRMSRSKSGALACLKILHLRWRCRSNLCLSAKSPPPRPRSTSVLVNLTRPRHTVTATRAHCPKSITTRACVTTPPAFITTSFGLPGRLQAWELLPRAAPGP